MSKNKNKNVDAVEALPVETETEPIVSASAFSDDEVRAAVERLKSDRVKAAARRNSPEGQAKAKDARAKAAAKKAAMLERAAELGLI